MSRELEYYKRLLRFYPTAYRKRYGDQMVQTLSDMLDDADTRPKRMLVWMNVASDLPVSLAKAQLQYAGSAFRSDTPDYLKQGGRLASILVLPFFLALIANGLDKVIHGHDLYNSWLWRLPYLGIWVLWFPLVALIITIVTYGRYVLKPSKSLRKASWLRRAFDLLHAWPIMAPGIVAFGILFLLAFHDSAHCWVQNPTHFVTKFHKTLSCTENGFSAIGW